MYVLIEFVINSSIETLISNLKFLNLSSFEVWFESEMGLEVKIYKGGQAKHGLWGSKVKTG